MITKLKWVAHPLIELALMSDPPGYQLIQTQERICVMRAHKEQGGPVELKLIGYVKSVNQTEALLESEERFESIAKMIEAIEPGEHTLMLQASALLARMDAYVMSKPMDNSSARRVSRPELQELVKNFATGKNFDVLWELMPRVYRGYFATSSALVKTRTSR